MRSAGGAAEQQQHDQEAVLYDFMLRFSLSGPLLKRRNDRKIAPASHGLRFVDVAVAAVFQARVRHLGRDTTLPEETVAGFHPEKRTNSSPG